MNTHLPIATRLRTSQGESTTMQTRPASSARRNAVARALEFHTAHNADTGSRVSSAGFVSTAIPAITPKTTQRRVSAPGKSYASQTSTHTRNAETPASHTHAAGQHMKYGTRAHIQVATTAVGRLKLRSAMRYRGSTVAADTTEFTPRITTADAGLKIPKTLKMSAQKYG